MKAAHPTLRDLLREAGGPVPVMLAVTVLVQVLGALGKHRRRGRLCGELSLDDVRLTGAPPRALLDDPSRDPRVQIVLPEIADARATPAPLHGAVALFRELLTGAPPAPRAEVSGVAGRLLRQLEEALSLDQALAEARALGLELLATWDRRRSSGLEADPRDLCAEIEARQRLAAAVYAGQRREVTRQGRELIGILGTDAGDDQDLALARSWLLEEQELRSRQRSKLFLTGAPLVLATLLTGLLGVVMLFSG